jgi:hypothetical protein
MHVTTERTRGLRHDDVVVDRTSQLLPADFGRAYGIPVTSPLRAGYLVIEVTPDLLRTPEKLASLARNALGAVVSP